MTEMELLPLKRVILPCGINHGAMCSIGQNWSA